MNKILNYVSWALLTFFLVPSGLIMASWNAVPGDALYPVKTGLEKTLVKITPSLALQSSLEMSYTERRLGETEALLADAYRAQETIQSLNNLDAQVAQAQYAIESVTDPSQKAALAERYIDTLARISSKLEQNKQNLAATPDYQTPTMAVRTQPVVTQQTGTESQARTAQTNTETQAGNTQPTTMTQPAQITQPTQPSIAPTTQQQTIVAPKPTTLPQTLTPTTLATPRVVPSPSSITTTATSQTTVATRLATSQTTINTTITNMQRLRMNNSIQESSTQNKQDSQNEGIKNTEEKKPVESTKSEEQKTEQKVEQKTEQKTTTTDQVKVETKTEGKTDTNTENSNSSAGN